MYTIEALAELLTSNGIDSPYSTDYDSPALAAWKAANPHKTAPYSDFPMWKRLNLDESLLPDGWCLKVSNLFSERARAAFDAKVDAEIALLPPALRLAIEKSRHGKQSPKPADLSDLVKTAMTDRRYPSETGRENRDGSRMLIGPSPYQPKPGCNLRMKLKQAVQFEYQQASYADHTRYVIPVEAKGEVGDLNVCRQNLRDFCEALRTHTGLAGSGCTWSAELVETAEGLVVMLDCRASICD